MNGSIELSLVPSSGSVAVEANTENLAITTATDEMGRRNSLNSLDTKCTEIQTEHELLRLHMEASNVTRCSTCNEVVLLIL